MDIILSYFRVEELLLLGAVLVFFLIELYYWVFVFGRVALQRQRSQLVTGKQSPVSIVLSARNEYEMLQKNLPLILSQDYPEFEVIVVNDCSEDDSEIFLAFLKEQHPNLVVRTIETDSVFGHNKKMALGIGIKAAQYDLLLFLDADCYPSCPQWLHFMQRYFVEKKEIVIGYTRLTNTAKWIRADHFMQGLHYMGRALSHRAYMGNNSNLAYCRELFFSNKGFDMRVTESLREDIVLINKIANRKNTAVALAPEATTVSTLHYSTDTWKFRRLQELLSLNLTGRGPRYPALSEAIFRLLFFASIVVSAIVFISDYIVLLSLLGLLLIRFTGQLILFAKSQKRLGEKGLLFTLLLWDLVSPLFYFRLILAANFKRKKTWR